MQNHFIVEEIINNEHISEESVNEYIRRPRALIINSKNEVLICYGSLTTHYEFPGGHLEEGETIKEALVREVKEETGIDITNEKFIPFYHQQYLCKDYPHIGANSSIEFFYYVVYADKEINMKNTNLDTNEQNENLRCFYTPVSKVDDLLTRNEIESQERTVAARDIHHIWRLFLENQEQIEQKKTVN